MFERIILCDNYFRVFLGQLNDSGYIKRPPLIDFLDADFNRSTAIKWLGKDGYEDVKLATLQMAMLADDIIIYDPMNEMYNWDISTCKSYNILVKESEQNEYLPDENEKRYVDKYIRPIVIKRMKNKYKANLLPEKYIDIILSNTTQSALEILPQINIDWIEWIIEIQSTVMDIIDIQKLSTTNFCPVLKV
jgi:hypothetical protein